MDREQRRQYEREYRQRPEVKARQQVRRSSPEAREHKRAYDQAHRQKPDVQERLREARDARRERPGVREQDREKQQAWHRAHPLNSSWRSMLARCEKPTHHQYRNYGARGIRVCAEWHDFAVFEAWIMANLGPRPEGCTLDRKDNNGNYEPGNVQWATGVQQARNRRFPSAMTAPLLPYEGCER